MLNHASFAHIIKQNLLLQLHQSVRRASHCLKGSFLLTAMSERAHFINPGVIPSVEAQTLGELNGHLGSCIFTSPP